MPAVDDTAGMKSPSSARTFPTDGTLRRVASSNARCSPDQFLRPLIHGRNTRHARLDPFAQPTRHRLVGLRGQVGDRVPEILRTVGAAREILRFALQFLRA
jgi:hypothetical protein